MMPLSWVGLAEVGSSRLRTMKFDPPSKDWVVLAGSAMSGTFDQLMIVRGAMLVIAPGFEMSALPPTTVGVPWSWALAGEWTVSAAMAARAQEESRGARRLLLVAG